MVGDKVVCERWCVWQSGVWKMVCDKVVCERWCDKVVCVWVSRRAAEEEEKEEERGGTESKTRTPHKDVGEKMPSWFVK